MLELATKRLSALPSVRTIHADATAIPLPRNSVDDVVAAWVVGHMPRAQRREVISEVRRVARQGARLFLLESAEESELQSLRDESGGRRDAGLIARLVSEGFETLQRVETAIEFDSCEDALRVLGFLCGAEDALRENPRRRFGHAVQLLSLAL